MKSSRGINPDWQKGVELIDSLTKPNSRVFNVLTPEESQGLMEVRKLLVSGAIKENAIPSDLIESEDNHVNRYLAEEFGGIKRGADFKKAAKSVMNGLRFIKTAKSVALLKAQSPKLISEDNKLFVPPEWERLSASRQNYVYKLLSYEKLSRWDYDIFELSVACGELPMLFIGFAIMAAPHAQKAMALSIGLEPPEEDEKCYEFVEEFNVEPEKLCNFLRMAENDHSKDNPYHNNIHAADTIQTTFALLRMGGDKYSTPLEVFSLLCAAACHDMGHPGKNNGFQVNSKSDLALIYNDTSVLENMHAARAYRLLTSKNMEILSGLNPSQQELFRVSFTKSILGTDMTQHFSRLAQLKSKISSHGTGDSGKFYHNVDGKSISSVLLFLLHLADISNPAKPSPVFVEWSDRCLNEYFAQGDAEKKLSLPVSPMCDRDFTVKSDSQIGFIKYIVRPSFVLFSDLVPAVVDEILPLLETNLIYWEKKKAEEETESMSDEIC